MNDSIASQAGKPRASGRYVRPMSPVERYSLMLHEAFRYQVDGIVEGIGSVDRDALQRAVDIAAEANPGIRVRLRGVLRWCRWVDSGKAPEVRLLPLTDWDGSSERNAPFLLDNLRPRSGGAVADLIIVPCTDGRTRIVFRSVHTAIDGRGLLHWVAEVSRVMRGENPLGSDSRLVDIDLQEQYADKLAPEADPPPPPLHCIPVVPPSDEGRHPLGYIWRRVILHRNVSQLLPKTAAFLADYARRREPGDIAFTVPVDFRGLRTQEMSIGNLTGFVQLNVPEGSTPRSLMRQLGEQLRDYADCRPYPKIRILYWIPMWLMLRKAIPQTDTSLYTVTDKVTSGGVVSMGTLDAASYSYPGFDVKTVYGIPGTVGKLNIVFFNYADFAVVSFAAPAAYNHEGQLDELIEAYQQHFSKSGAALEHP